MLQTRSFTCLPVVALAFLCAIATWTLVFGVGEGGEIQFATENYPESFLLLGVVTSFVCFFLKTWFIPTEFAPGVIRGFRVLRAVLVVGVLALTLGVIACLPAFLIETFFEFESPLLMCFLEACFYFGKCGFYLSFLTVLVGGFMGIAVDLSVLASRVRLPKARYR